MELFFYLLALIFGADVHRLGDRDYAARSAAHRRLERAGAWAVPVLERGLASANPEAANRTAILLGRRTDWRAGVAEVLVAGPWVPADVIEAVAGVAAADERLAAAIYHRVDASGWFSATNSRAWTESRPYMSRTLAGDMTYMLTETRRRRALLEVPRTMPPPNWWE